MTLKAFKGLKKRNKNDKVIPMPRTNEQYRRRVIKLYHMLKGLEKFLYFDTLVQPHEDFARVTCGGNKGKVNSLNSLFERISKELKDIEENILEPKQRKAA